MKIFELAEQLKKIWEEHGDIEVMFETPTDGSLWQLTNVEFSQVDKSDEYPEDWNMPIGLKFAKLGQ